MTGIEAPAAVSPISRKRDEKAPGAGGDNAHIALFMRDLKGGGIQKSLLRLAESFYNRGLRIDLVVCKTKGPHREHIPRGVNLVPLEGTALKPADRVLAVAGMLAADPLALWPLLPLGLLTPWMEHVPALTRYLRQSRPQALLAAGNVPNWVALLARRTTGMPARLVVSERNHLSAYTQGKSRRWRWRYAPRMIARTYPWADAIVAVSDGVADELALSAGLPRERINTIYNPIVSAELLAQAKAPLNHGWFGPKAPPVVLGVGSLDQQKNFPALLRAFARVKAQRPVRLMILGEGKGRAQLEGLAERLGIAGDVSLPGFVDNPFAYMARAAVFVLSSTYEGLPAVLVEALACGCPVVSTDCPSGPAEILQGGRYGRLVTVGDDHALAQAIVAVLDDPPDPERLKRRGAEFSVERGTERYLEILLGKL